MRIEGLSKKIIITMVMILLQVVLQLLFFKVSPITILSYFLYIGLAPLILMALYSYSIGIVCKKSYFESVLTAFLGCLINIAETAIITYLFVNDHVIKLITESFSSVSNKNVSVSVNVGSGNNILFYIVISFIICVGCTRLGSRHNLKPKKVNIVDEK